MQQGEHMPLLHVRCEASALSCTAMRGTAGRHPSPSRRVSASSCFAECAAAPALSISRVLLRNLASSHIDIQGARLGPPEPVIADGSPSFDVPSPLWRCLHGPGTTHGVPPGLHGGLRVQPTQKLLGQKRGSAPAPGLGLRLWPGPCHILHARLRRRCTMLQSGCERTSAAQTSSSVNEPSNTAVSAKTPPVPLTARLSSRGFILPVGSSLASCCFSAQTLVPLATIFLTCRPMPRSM
mmetsp:Transcript_100219/g.323326  ORF Transcript_100219/g.323326 Transcript_100219/m.323326 type:complete len:238 (+) Transcript_100219:183-896(+)